jgi:hypothetical protein
MPFHVELRRGFQRASAFNLDRGALQRVVLDPWAQGRPVDLGDREWDPLETELQILEGPHLEGPDLALGRGWQNAERGSEDVTAPLLERIAADAASVAVVAATSAAAEAVSEALTRLEVREVGWSGVRARILGSAAIDSGPPSDLGAGAVLLAAEGEQADPAWLFDAGLAVGALGGRAIAVQLGEGPPPAPMRDLAVLRLDPADEATSLALGERLRKRD